MDCFCCCCASTEGTQAPQDKTAPVIINMVTVGDIASAAWEYHEQGQRLLLWPHLPCGGQQMSSVTIPIYNYLTPLHLQNATVHNNFIHYNLVIIISVRAIEANGCSGVNSFFSLKSFIFFIIKVILYLFLVFYIRGGLICMGFLSLFDFYEQLIFQ